MVLISTFPSIYFHAWWGVSLQQPGQRRAVKKIFSPQQTLECLHCGGNRRVVRYSPTIKRDLHCCLPCLFYTVGECSERMWHFFMYLSHKHKFARWSMRLEEALKPPTSHFSCLREDRNRIPEVRVKTSEKCKSRWLLPSARATHVVSGKNEKTSGGWWVWDDGMFDYMGNCRRLLKQEVIWSN